MNDESFLEVSHLSTYFYTDAGVAKAVDDLSFAVPRGETLGLVGESGCGKTVTALSIMRLLACPPARIVGGKVILDGADLLTLPEPAMQKVRGNRMAMIFQEPMTSLNPVFRIGYQLAEPLIAHRGLRGRAARERAVRMLRRVGIPEPERAIECYPHQMSGGMRQRVMIAMALGCEPQLLIADEPTTALDVTIQAQILKLLGELRREFHMSVILITHNLGVVAQIADRVVVMYAGGGVEYAAVAELYANPRHPYTLGLFASLPTLEKRASLQPIAGTVPDPTDYPKGCKFRPRCPHAHPRCWNPPPLFHVGQGHQAACWLYA